VLVEDAKGQPPNIPFWFGEVPGRDDLLSAGVSELRTGIGERLEAGGDQARTWLLDAYGLPPAAADQLLTYYGVPTQDRIVLERFFDEVGDMHLVVHSPYGSRLNRAWGLALRKRFYRTFNFELQAAALDDCIILSLGAVHSFALEDVKHFLSSTTGHRLLTQALLDVPLFDTHWRWNATTARHYGGQQGAAADPTLRGRGPGRAYLSGPARVPGEPPGRARDTGPPAGRSNPRGLPYRGHGYRRSGTTIGTHRIRCGRGDRP